MKAFCKQCKLETNHTILHEEKRDFSNQEEGIYINDFWQIIKCNGCEDLSFRRVWINSDNIDPEDNTQLEDITLFPLRGADILPIKNYYNVHYKIRKIYREVVDAFNNGMPVLCAGGLRAIIEGICNIEGIKDGPVEIDKSGVKTKRKKDLQGKIIGLHEKGLLTKQHSDILQEHRFLGNDALHSLDPPTQDELKLAIDIIELTLDNLYELKEKVEDLRYKKLTRKNK